MWRAKVANCKSAEDIVQLFDEIPDSEDEENEKANELTEMIRMTNDDDDLDIENSPEEVVLEDRQPRRHRPGTLPRNRRTNPDYEGFDFISDEEKNASFELNKPTRGQPGTSSRPTEDPVDSSSDEEDSEGGGGGATSSDASRVASRLTSPEGASSRTDRPVRQGNRRNAGGTSSRNSTGSTSSVTSSGSRKSLRLESGIVTSRYMTPGKRRNTDDDGAAAAAAPATKRVRKTKEEKALEKKAADEEKEVREIERRLVALVLDITLTTSLKRVGRIKHIKEFKFNTPKNCPESRKGGAEGSWHRKGERCQAPGVPNRKFSKEDVATHGSDVNKNWHVQAVYLCPKDPSMVNVLYEGWASSTMGTLSISECEVQAAEMIRQMRLRNGFLEKVYELLTAENREFTKDTVSGKGVDSTYWLWQDLTFFHSMLHEEHGLAPIFYINLNKAKYRPFAYTPINVVLKQAYTILIARDANLKFNQLCEKRNISTEGYRIYEKGPCEKKSACICDQRATILYGEQNGYNGHRFADSLTPNDDGTLNLKTFIPTRARVLVECSDRCGCSFKCPRRQLQRGQQKALVIFFEGKEKGFGVRVAEAYGAGEFVTEYTGLMKTQVETHDEDCHIFGLATQPIQKTERGAIRMKKEADEKRKSREEEEIQKAMEANGWDVEKENVSSYEAGFNVMDTTTVISANAVGNVARFINHSCDPNTAFIETYSRRFESDPLIPRIAVYTVKEVAVGEELTCNYYAGIGTAENGKVKCCCNSAKCRGYLPK